MATEVKVNLDLLDEAKRVYDTEIDQLQKAMDELSTAIEQLRCSDWKTNGAEEFFKNYDGSWKVKLKEHIEYLEYLRDCLASAQAGFHEEYSQQNKLYQ